MPELIGLSYMPALFRFLPLSPVVSDCICRIVSPGSLSPSTSGALIGSMHPVVISRSLMVLDDHDNYRMLLSCECVARPRRCVTTSGRILLPFWRTTCSQLVLTGASHHSCVDVENCVLLFQCEPTFPRKTSPKLKRAHG